MSLNLPEHPSHEFLKTLARQRLAAHPGHQRADVDFLAAGVARAERGCVAV